MSIAPRFWPSKPLAGLGRIWNRYLLTMLTWNRRDSMPLSAAPRAPKDDQGWIFWSYKSLSGLPDSGPYRIFVLVFNWNHFEMRLLKLRINFYLLRTFCPNLVIVIFFLCCFFFHYVSAKFHLWPSSGDLPRPRIGMLSLVTCNYWGYGYKTQHSYPRSR